MSFRPYPKYKDSGVEWLGQVPEHWELTRLKRIAGIRYGIGEPPRYHEEGTPLVRATNIHAGRLFAEGMVYVNPDDIPEKRVVWLDPGDIVVVRSGAYTGDSAIIPRGFGQSIAGFDMVLRCHSADSEFVQYALLSNYLKDGQIELERMRAAQPHLNAEELGSCLLVLPGTQEQRGIVEFLDRETAKIDALVAEQRRLMELLKEKRQAVISHAVTKGLNPDAPMKPSGIEWLGDVPAHWTVPKLKSIASIYGGGTPSRENLSYWNGSIPWVSPKDMKNERVRCSEEAVTREGLANSASVLVPAGRVLLVVRSGILKHTIPVAINEVEVAISQDLKAVDLNPTRCLGEFLLRWIQGLNEKLLLVWPKQGATVESIEQAYLESTLIPLPPVDEQAVIVKRLTTRLSELDALVAEAQRAIDLLQERRAALISAAVTGQIDVRGLVPAGAA